MFIKKNIEKGSILAMKLSTGEEIIAKVISHDVGADKLVVSKPIAVGMGPNGSVAFMPYMLGLADDGEIILNMRFHVVTYANAREELKNAYIQNTSGITPAGGSMPEGLVGI